MFIVNPDGTVKLCCKNCCGTITFTGEGGDLFITDERGNRATIAIAAGNAAYFAEFCEIDSTSTVSFAAQRSSFFSVPEHLDGYIFDYFEAYVFEIGTASVDVTPVASGSARTPKNITNSIGGGVAQAAPLTVSAGDTLSVSLNVGAIGVAPKGLFVVFRLSPP